MMEAMNGEQVTFRRMDEILENVTHALELPLLQAERVVAEACRQWSDLERLVSQKLRTLNNVRKMCVRMDKGRLPIVVKALEAIEDAEPEVVATLFSELHAALTRKVTTEVSPVKRTRTENTVIAQPPAAATTVTTTSTPPKPKQMQAEGSTRRQPQRSSKKTAAGVQRADEDVIAHERKQAEEVEVTNLVSDEDDDADMKDELELRHEGMSKRRCEYVRGPRIGEPQRRQEI